MQNPGFEIEVLLQDDDFIRWVISPDKQSDEYWNSWQQQDPVRRTILRDAKKILLSVYRHERLLTDALDKDVTRKAWEEISRHVQTKAAKRSLVPGIFRFVKYAVAASVVVIAGVFLFLAQHKPVKPFVSLNEERPAISSSDSTEIQLSNNTDEQRLINLPDGSRIVLSKNSSLHYIRLFNKGKREVYLTGEAFFEVTKDANRPFYVYSGNVVTKVLGTSFRIISDDRYGQVTIAVRSGKVKVFRQNDARHQQDQYLLIRNQQLVFREGEAKPVKADLREEARPAEEMTALPNFSFEEAALPDIFSTLTKAYHIDIVYDNAGNEKYRVTVVLEGETLYDKLDLLCRVIGATYHMEGNRIYIESRAVINQTKTQ